MFKGFFPSRFIYITGFTKRPETTARTTASGRILGGIFAFLEKSSKNWSKSGCWPTIGPPDRPDPAITYYKYLRGFFIHQFFSISPNLQNDLRVPPGLPLPHYVLKMVPTWTNKSRDIQAMRPPKHVTVGCF